MTTDQAKFKQIEDVKVLIISTDSMINDFDIEIAKAYKDFQKKIEKDIEKTRKAIDVVFDAVIDLVNKRNEDATNIGNAKVMLNQLIDLIKGDPDFTGELSDVEELKSRIETLDDKSSRNDRQKKMADIGEVPKEVKKNNFIGDILDRIAPKK